LSWWRAAATYGLKWFNGETGAFSSVEGWDFEVGGHLPRPSKSPVSP